MYEVGGIETINILTNIILIFLGVLFMLSTLVGYLEGPQSASKVQSKSDLLEYFKDDEDVYAVLTGDMDYLAAHCTLKEEPLHRPRPSKTKPQPAVKPQQAVKPKRVKPCTTKVGREAATGLASLGYKKSEANLLVNDILTTNPDMTSEQVVMEVINK